ncbi:MAG: FKBP-type peptidyl-prolyl cis-trans isomerase [Sphingomonas sp.]|jgi:FKBP-type peptidyl-prolyl cis-trans isomerase FkpA|uniref:FKBP-type peptidyl-prolyl cis-trans isomerase n=1 Tax=Sphingomonas sp. TaxID=28214 RepID=UPI0035696218
MSITAVPLKPVKRSILVYLWLGIAVALVAAVALAFQTPSDPATAFLAHNARAKGVVTTPSGLQYQVLTPGTGTSPTDADVVLILYEGRLLNGTVFDKSPQPTPIEVGGVVPGFSEALKLMNKGGKYRLWLKPSLGYGDHVPPGGPIPANAVLVFDVELLDAMPVLKYKQMQQMMQQQGMIPPGAGGPPTGH